MKSSMGIHFLTVVDHDLSAGLLHTSSSTAPLYSYCLRCIKIKNCELKVARLLALSTADIRYPSQQCLSFDQFTAT